MYLAIMLIIVAVLVVYNEYNKTMNIAEIGLLIVALIAIIRASMNYINTNDSIGMEGFTNNSNKNKSRKANVKSKGRNSNDDSIELDSSRSQEYFDTDTNTNKSGETMISTPQSTQHTNISLNKNKVDADAVNQVNSILGIKSRFGDVTSNSSSNGIDSVFVPQIQIGQGRDNSSRLELSGMSMYGLNSLGVAGVNDLASGAADVGAGDGMSFPNTMKPSSNLWSSDMDYMDASKNWSQSLDDFNNGKWNPKLYSTPSDFTDYFLPSAYGMSTGNTPAPTATTRSNFGNTPSQSTVDSYGQPQKLCGAYDDLALDQAGNLVVQNYTQAKKWMPGYTYVPPVYWDVPQRHNSICQGANPSAKKLTGLVDRGLPINALELDPEGKMAATEDTVSLTNVGSIMPRFNYQETPFSKPYI